MKPFFITFTLVLLFICGLNLGGCNYRAVPDIKAHAAKAWDETGFEIVGYYGYEIGTFIAPAPGGKVWYIVQRKGDSRIRYTGYLTKWGDEYQAYYVHPLDSSRINGVNLSP